MNKKILKIRGMHCRSCEILIEDKLRELPGVKSAQVSYKKQEATIYSKNLLSDQVLERAVREAGYDLGVDDNKSWISNDLGTYKDLAVAAIVLFVLYFIAKKIGLTNLNITAGRNPSSLLVILLIGLTAGVSTCMALVGGLILGVSARHSEKLPSASSAQKFIPHIYFNVGRIASYFFLGGLIGLAGKAFQLSGTFLGILIIVVGIVMLIMGFQLTELFPRLSNGGLTLPASVSKFLGIKKHQNKEYSNLNSMLLGALTFFLPCGFTQAMQLYAMSTGSFASGALIMGAFALGTAPGLLGVGGLTSVIKGAFAKKFFKFTGILVISLAIFNIGNGFNLTGWRILSTGNSKSITANDPNVSIDNGVQVVRMDQLAGGYKPNIFTIKKGMPVKWIINAKKADACSGSILASKIGVRQILNPGENIIEFTPTFTGEIKFSCLMGMYTGKFIVVDTKQISDSKTSGSPDTNSNGNSVQTAPPTSSVPSPQSQSSELQLIKSTFNLAKYGATTDITPNEFTVAAGKPVRLEILANADGSGCMGSVAIPGLTKQIDFFEKGKTITFDFTPTKKGNYKITCAMGVPRGTINVI